MSEKQSQPSSTESLAAESLAAESLAAESLAAESLAPDASSVQLLSSHAASSQAASSQAASSQAASSQAASSQAASNILTGSLAPASVATLSQHRFWRLFLSGLPLSGLPLSGLPLSGLLLLGVIGLGLVLPFGSAWVGAQERADGMAGGSERRASGGGSSSVSGNGAGGAAGAGNANGAAGGGTGTAGASDPNSSKRGGKSSDSGTGATENISDEGAGPESQAPGNPPDFRVMAFQPDGRAVGQCLLDGWRGGDDRCVDRVQFWDGWTLPEHFADDKVLRNRTENVLKAMSKGYFLLQQDLVARWMSSPVESGESVKQGLLSSGVYRLPVPSSSWMAWGPSSVRLPSSALTNKDVEQAKKLRSAVRSTISLPPADRWMVSSLCQRLLYASQEGELSAALAGADSSLCTDSFSKYFKIRGKTQYRLGHLFATERESQEGPFLEQMYPVHLLQRPPWPARSWFLSRDQDTNLFGNEANPQPTHVRSVYDMLTGAYQDVIDKLSMAMLRYGPRVYSSVQLRTWGALALMNSTAPSMKDAAAVRPENAGDLGNTDTFSRPPRDENDPSEDLADPDWTFAFDALPPGLVDSELSAWMETLPGNPALPESAPASVSPLADATQLSANVGGAAASASVIAPAHSIPVATATSTSQQAAPTEGIAASATAADAARRNGRAGKEKGKKSKKPEPPAVLLPTPPPFESLGTATPRDILARAEAAWAAYVDAANLGYRVYSAEDPMGNSLDELGCQAQALIICHQLFEGEESATVRQSCVEGAAQTLRQHPEQAAMSFQGPNNRPLLVPLKPSRMVRPEPLPRSLQLEAWEGLIGRLDPDDGDGLRVELYTALLSYLMEWMRAAELWWELVPVTGEPDALPPGVSGTVTSASTVRAQLSQLLHAWEWLWAEALPPDANNLPSPELGFEATRRMTEQALDWFKSIESVERPYWIASYLELTNTLKQYRTIGEVIPGSADPRDPESKPRLRPVSSYKAWSTVYRYVAKGRPRLPEEWPKSLHPEELMMTGVEPLSGGTRLRRTTLYARILLVLQDIVVETHAESLSRLAPVDRAMQEQWLRQTVFRELMFGVWRTRWETAYPPQAHQASVLRSSRLFDALMPSVSALEKNTALERCTTLQEGSSGTWDRWGCEVDVLLNMREIPQGSWARHRLRLNVALLKALTQTLGQSSQRTYRRWVFLRHSLATLDQMVQGKSAWSPSGLEQAVQSTWERFLTLHGLKGRREESEFLPSVNPLAVCSSPTSGPEARMQETSIHQVVVDLIFDAPDDKRLSPASVLWEARKQLPFVAIDGSSRSLGTQPDASDTALTIEPLFRVPALDGQGSTRYRRVYRARWRVWSGWHLFWNVAQTESGWLPVLRTGAVCQDTLIMQSDLEASLWHWAVLKDAAPTRPLKLGIDYSEEEEIKLRNDMEQDRLERLAARQLDEENGTATALQYRAEDQFLGGALEDRTDEELTTLGYASLTPLQSQLRTQLRQHLGKWLRQRPMPVKPSARDLPTLLMAFDTSYLPLCRDRDEDNVWFYFRRTPYLRVRRNLLGDNRLCQVDVAGWSWAIRDGKDEILFTHVAPDYQVPSNPLLPPSSLVWRPRLVTAWSASGSLGVGLRDVEGSETIGDTSLADTIGFDTSTSPYAFRDNPLDVSLATHMSFWLSERARLGFEMGALTRFELLGLGHIQTLIDPVGEVVIGDIAPSVVVKPSAGVSVGIRVAPAPRLSRFKFSPWYPWGTAGQEKFSSRLLRNQYGLRGRAMMGVSSGKAETTVGGEVWNVFALPQPRGLLAGFVPYVPRGNLGLYGSVDYGWTTFGESAEGEAFSSPVEHIWTFSLGLRAQVDLVHMRLK